MSPKKRRLRRILRIGGLALLVLLGLLLLPLVGVVVECRVFSQTEVPPPSLSPESQAMRAQLSADIRYARNEEQTYLTLPEWYIVFSADEYAAFIEKSPPSQFPYFQAIRQYWQSYYDVCALTRDEYTFNGRYHTILAVIGVSFTFENLIKGVYENSIGRLTEWLSSDELTPEDAYHRQVAKAYGDFIHTIPWFEFPFAEKLKGLWTETSGWGPNLIRKWERKFALSLEYGGKSFYGWVIKGGNEASFEPVDVEMTLWVAGLTPEILEQEPDIQLIKRLDDQTSVVIVPRYEAFTQMTPRLVAQGVRFVEIAGNDQIMMTIIGPATWPNELPAGQFLFDMPVLSQSELKRVAWRVPVKELHRVLAELESRGLRLEHIYDY
jgi:hypothetical protein